MEENYIPVLTKDRRPLAPCRPQRAKSLVRSGKASFQHKSGIRCIVLHKTNVPKLKNKSKLTLRLDPGSRTTGIASPGSTKTAPEIGLIGIEIAHQGRAVSRRLTKRSQLRRNRRYRKTRFRQHRPDKRTKPEGWLSPSILSRLHNTLTWVNRLATMLPITEIHVETNVFDPQVLRNPEIKGAEYQQGPLYRTNLRTAVMTRDSNRCVYCNRSGEKTPLELDHAAPRASNGPDRYDNLVASCIPCNRRKDKKPLEEFLKRRPAKLAEIQEKLGMDLADPTHMNIIIPRLITTLEEQGWKVVQHSAATTAAGRIACGIEKSHYGDAAVTGCPKELGYLPGAPITIKATGRGNRQRVMPDKHGTPKGKVFRNTASCHAPCREEHQLPATKRGRRESETSPPATTSPSCTKAKQCMATDPSVTSRWHSRSRSGKAQRRESNGDREKTATKSLTRRHEKKQTSRIGC